MASYKRHGVVSVETLDTRINALDQDFNRIEARFDALEQNLNTSIGSLRDLITINQKPQWGVVFSGVGVMVAVLGLIGAMAYWPINGGLTEAKSAIIDLSREAISKHQYDADMMRIERRLDQVEHH